jgi:hypothetical protein
VTLPAIERSPELSTAVTHAAPETLQGFIYGQITDVDGTTYEGRLRWGGKEEAFWGDYFNGFTDKNPWTTQVPPEQLNKARPLKIFGVKIADRERRIDLGRPFMGRFGDIASIWARGNVVKVTLKSGTVFDLDRLSADDLADGVRVWDVKRGVVDLNERLIRKIEFLPTPSQGTAPYRLHGTVHTQQGDFTGFIQWDRKDCTGSDELDGKTPENKVSLRFDTIQSIARDSRDSSLVTLLDGREVVLSDTREVGSGNRGIYVNDPRYGRVFISWEAFKRVEFNSSGSGPPYEDFPTGHPLMGKVTTRTGQILTGRLVYDLDESETTQTFDAPSGGIDYTIPFGLIASIALPGREDRDNQPAKVTLHNGEELQFELTGDLGKRNAGMLVFDEGSQRPVYVPWADVGQVDFDRPSAMFPPLDGR